MDLLNIKDNVCKENSIVKSDNSNPSSSQNGAASVLLTTLKVDSADVRKVQLKIRTAEGQ